MAPSHLFCSSFHPPLPAFLCPLPGNAFRAHSRPLPNGTAPAFLLLASSTTATATAFGASRPELAQGARGGGRGGDGCGGFRHTVLPPCPGNTAGGGVSVAAHVLRVRGPGLTGVAPLRGRTTCSFLVMGGSCGAREAGGRRRRGRGREGGGLEIDVEAFRQRQCCWRGAVRVRTVFRRQSCRRESV